MRDDYDGFKLKFSQMSHSWLSTMKMNERVNAAIGVDMFSTKPFGCKLAEEGDEIVIYYPEGEYRTTREEFDADKAISIVEAFVNDSECS